MSGEQKRHFHDQPSLCDHILDSICGSTVPLRIGPSSIPNAGSGLFADQDIAAGSEIFRSEPQLLVCDPRLRDICHHCLLNKNTSIHPHGRFFRDQHDRNQIDINFCSGCMVVQYCSRDCEVKAWVSYHKNECDILKEKPGLNSVQLALIRLATWTKTEILGGNDARVVTNLETDTKARDDREREKLLSMGHEESYIDRMVASAEHIQLANKLGLAVGFVQQLGYALLSNSISIHPAEMQKSYGCCLDLVVSLINHACDANAHVFFEREELRCRSLKDIPAGSEITLYYLDAPFDVLHRRAELKEVFYFACECQECKDEMAEHVAAAVNRQNHIPLLRKAQEDLSKLSNSTWAGWARNPQGRNVNECLRYMGELFTIVRQGFPDGNWPHHMEPLPSALRVLGRMYLELSRLALGVEFVLKGTLYSRNRVSPPWVLSLLVVVKYVIMLSRSDEDGVHWEGARQDRELLGRSTLRDVARGYVSILCIDGKAAFGMDARFVQALHRWGWNIMQHMRQGDPDMLTDEFEARFTDSQEKLLTWAKMETGLGLRLPSREAIAELWRQIEILEACAE